MSDSFTIVLDTVPPAAPFLLINGGAVVTGDSLVEVRLTTVDYQSGAADVDDMKIWGDVDPLHDANIKASEGASSWQPYQEYVDCKLSNGTATKTVYARLRDDVGNETIAFSDQIVFDTVRPIVGIVTGVTNAKISKVAGFDTAVFSWQCNHPFVEYVVRAVASEGSPYNSGIPIPTLAGSTNVTATGSFPADTPITTTINGADLEAASPGNTLKVIKVFARDSSGSWSP